MHRRIPANAKKDPLEKSPFHLGFPDPLHRWCDRDYPAGILHQPCYLVQPPFPYPNLKNRQGDGQNSTLPKPFPYAVHVPGYIALYGSESCQNTMAYR